MNIAFGLVCLVVVVVLEGATSFPDQQLDLEYQSPGNDDDHLEYQRASCGTKHSCRIAGGECQSITDKNNNCDGELRTSRYYCNGPRTCGCCIPPGCLFDGKAYPNKSKVSRGCLLYTCIKGEWELGFANTCSDEDIAAPTKCGCGINRGQGCYLNQFTLPHKSCQCSLTGPVGDKRTNCTGVVVDCNDPQSDACKTPGMDLPHCLQGINTNGGNCAGYNT